MTGTPDGRTVRSLDGPSYLAGDASRGRGPGAKGAAEAIQDASFDFVHHGLRQVFEAQSLAISSEAICEHRLSPPDLSLLQALTLHA